MNRSFFIVIAPAILVGALAMAMNYGKVVPRPLAFAVAGVAAVALVWSFARNKKRDVPQK